MLTDRFLVEQFYCIAVDVESEIFPHESRSCHALLFDVRSYEHCGGFPCCRDYQRFGN